jgi:hypothetical protein
LCIAAAAATAAAAAIALHCCRSLGETLYIDALMELSHSHTAATTAATAAVARCYSCCYTQLLLKLTYGLRITSKLKINTPWWYIPLWFFTATICFYVCVYVSFTSGLGNCHIGCTVCRTTAALLPLWFLVFTLMICF